MAKADRVGTVDCADAEAFTQSYVDGELSGRDRARYERHLHECAQCAAAQRFASRMKAAVRGHLPRRQVPAAFEHRLRVAIGAQPDAPPRWPWLTWPRVVPALAAMGVMVAIVGTVHNRRSIVIEQARLTYQAEPPLDVKGPDCGLVTSWFRGRVNFPVHAPRLPAQITCQGGRLVNVEDQTAAYLVYRDPRGHRVSVLVFDPEAAPIEAPHHRVVGGRDVFFRPGPGIVTAAYRDQGLGYVMTADVGEDALAGLVQASFTQPSPASNELN